MAEETVRFDLTELLLELRAAGVKRYRNGGLEIEFHAEYQALPDPTVEAAEDAELTPSERHERALAMMLRSSGSAVPARLKAVKANPTAAE